MNFKFVSIFPWIIGLIFLMPAIFIFSSLTLGFNDNFTHVYDYLLIKYSINSILLVIGTCSIALILGVISAWLVVNHNFFGRNFFDWALLLPLAVPPYILAYVFTGFFDTYGTANILINRIFDLPNNSSVLPNVRNIYGAIIVFGFTLYPYVYLASRVAIQNLSNSLFEAARLLGKNTFQTFLFVSVPLIRPAIFAGISLVAMETLSDFGAVEHFAVPTFTTGIFRTWFGLYDLNTALQMASILLLVIFLLTYLERSSRAKVNDIIGDDLKRDNKIRFTGAKNFFAFTFCLTPILIGFIIPFFELLNWTFQQEFSNFTKFFDAASNTLAVSLFAGLLTCLIAMLMNFIVRKDNQVILGSLNNFLSLGYAFPGLILAVAITQIFTSLDNYFFSLFNMFLTGSIVGLIIAYVIKCYALPNNIISSTYNEISTNIDDSAKTLGASSSKIFKSIHLPILKPTIITGMLLVVAEVVKELPATLILRPFNFETLAVTTYIFASEERMFEAAPSAIAIVCIGMLPIYFLSKVSRKD